MATPEEVIFYDLPEGDTPASDLIALTADADAGWFARARLVAMARKGLIGAAWNPHLHPRGKDGKFIRKFGWVRWLDGGLWRSGRVADISATNGNLTVAVSKPDGVSTETFTPFEIQAKLTSAAAPKAALKLPNPKAHTDETGFTKVSNSLGSNHGGMYTVGPEFGDAKSLSKIDLMVIASKHGATALDVPIDDVPDGKYAIVRSWDGSLGLYLGGEDSYLDTNGDKVVLEPVKHDLTAYVVDDYSAAWSEALATAPLVAEGNKFYIKSAKSLDHAANEVLANRLYELAGVNVAEVIPGAPGTETLASKVVTGAEKVDLAQALDNTEALERLRNDFVIDAWLANWDVVGLGLENVQVVDDYPYRIDAGGALAYRAMGSPKGHMFGPSVGELETLLDPSMNSQAALAFKGTTTTNLQDGGQRLAAIHPDEILTLSEATWPSQGTSVGNTLIARRADILAKLGIADPHIADPEPEIGLPDVFDETLTPDAPEASTWAGVIPWGTPDQNEFGNLGMITDFTDDVAVVAIDLNANDVAEDVDWELSAVGVYGNPKPTLDMSGKAASIDAAKAAIENAYGPWYAENKAKTDYGDGYDGGFQPPSPVVLPTNAPLEWDSEDQVWGPGYANPQQSSPGYWAQKAQQIIDTKFEDTNVTQINLWDDAEPYVMVNGALYNIAHNESTLNGQPAVVLNRVHADGTWNGLHPELFAYADLPNGPNMPVYFTEQYTSDNLDTTLATLLSLQTALQDTWITSTVMNTPMVNVVQEAGLMNTADSDVGTAGVPDLKITPLMEGFPGDSVDKYIWDPGTEKILQVKAVDANGKGTLSDAVTGEDVGAPVFDGSVYLFDTNDEFTHNFVVAKVEYEAANKEPGPADAVPTPVDPDLIAKLDAQAALHDMAAAADAPAPDPLPEVPDPEPTEGLTPTAPASIPNVSNKLGVGEKFSFAGMTPEERQAAAEGMIGKVYLGAIDTYLNNEDDTLHIGSGNSHILGMSLFYAESMEPDGRINLRAPSGKLSTVTPSSTSNHWFEALGVSPDMLKVAKPPTLKADGDLVVNGQVVGTWSKAGWSSWNTTYNYTLHADYTLNGKQISGTTYTKSNIKPITQNLMVPMAPPVKTKKGSKAVEKIQAAINTKPGAVLSDGTEAELGQWVKSTKGGGGFVGKIVGWPDQETHPGLAFAVSDDGVQKAVKLKTQKKVSGPAEESSLGGYTVVGEQTVPSAYTGIKLADGNAPLVGQKVKAGKPGSEVEGIITNINPEQGWVYILKPDGKTVSKTYSVTTVLEEPDLIWDLDSAVAAAALAAPTKKAKKSDPKINYPGPDGALLDHDPDAEAAWLAGHPSRKLTKDGYAPKKGMLIRTSKGDLAVILGVAGEWEDNPNKLSVYNFATQKKAVSSATTAQIDHAAELTGFDGKPLQKVSSVHLLGATDSADQLFPNGSVVYRAKTTVSWWSNKSDKMRSVDEWRHVVVAPDGTTTVIGTNYNGETKTSYSWNGLQGFLKNTTAADLEKVAVIDSASTKAVQVQPWHSSGWGDNQKMVFSKTEFVDYNAPTPVSVDSDTGVADAVEAVLDDVVEDIVEAAPDPLGEIPGNIESPEAPEAPDVPDDDSAVSTAAPPAIIPAGSINTLTPPPQPPQTVVKKADPDLPPVTDEVGDLSQVHQSVVGTPILSVAQAAQEMIAKKDSTDPGTGTTYAMGDSDFIEDMAIRYNVVKGSDGTEQLVARFRLRESVSEDVVARMMTTGDGKTGAWKMKGTSWPMELEVGDSIAIYLSGHTQLLKPENDSHPLDEPNARVVSKAVKIGKSPTNPTRDLYRIKVQTEDGQIGEVDLEHRESSSIKVFEYDPTAPALATGKSLKLTPTAQEAGWVRHGQMAVMGSPGSVHIDKSGKAFYGSTGLTYSMSKGSGGHHLTRTMPDGTSIRLNSAHSTEGGIGFDTTRRANLAGEVQISIPIEAGKPSEKYDEALSRAMQAVGVPVEKQGPPTDEQLVNLALAKLVTNYHPDYKYRDKPIEGPDDKRVTETLSYMSKELNKWLGRDVTLDDVRVHTHDNGRVQFVLSPDVAKAIGKRQGNHHFHHGGAQGRVVEMFTGVANGLLSTDERWSLGVMTTGQSSQEDMRIGSGDRIYTRATQKKSFSPGTVVFNPVMQATSMEVYTEGSSDHYGRRGTTNLFMTKGGHIEYMYKRRYEPEQITFYIASSEAERADLISKIKKRGVTHVGGRAIEDIIVTEKQALAADNFDSLGEEFWANDIPISQVIGATP